MIRKRRWTGYLNIIQNTFISADGFYFGSAQIDETFPMMVLPSVWLHSIVDLRSCREGSKRKSRRPGSSERAGKRGRGGGELLGQLGGELLARGGEAPITASSHARHIPSPEDSDQGACSYMKDWQKSGTPGSFQIILPQVSHIHIDSSVFRLHWWEEHNLFHFLIFKTRGKKRLLRILLKQNTALLSYVCVLVSHRRDISSFLDNLIV